MRRAPCTELPFQTTYKLHVIAEDRLHVVGQTSPLPVAGLR